VDESGFSDCPPLRRTWAPRGQTPVVRSRGRSWRRLAATGALLYRGDGRRARVLLRFFTGTVKSAETLTFLRHLRRHVRGKAILIWDGLGAHWSREVRDYIHAQRRWLTVVRLPAYAPDLNPVEGLWAWTKQGGFANTAPDDLDDIRQRARRTVARGRRRQPLLWAFLAKAGLSLRPRVKKTREAL
jgi:transposase